MLNKKPQHTDRYGQRRIKTKFGLLEERSAVNFCSTGNQCGFSTTKKEVQYFEKCVTGHIQIDTVTLFYKEICKVLLTGVECME